MVVIGSISNNNGNALVNHQWIINRQTAWTQTWFGMFENIRSKEFFFKIWWKGEIISPFNISKFRCFSPLRDSTVWLQLERFPRIWRWCAEQLGKQTWVDSCFVEAYKKDDAKQILKLWNLWKDEESSLLNLASQVLFALTCCIHEFCWSMTHKIRIQPSIASFMWN